MIDHRYEGMNRLTIERIKLAMAEAIRKKKFSLTVAINAIDEMMKTIP